MELPFWLSIPRSNHCRVYFSSQHGSMEQNQPVADLSKDRKKTSLIFVIVLNCSKHVGHFPRANRIKANRLDASLVILSVKRKGNEFFFIIIPSCPQLRGAPRPQRGSSWRGADFWVLNLEFQSTGHDPMDCRQCHRDRESKPNRSKPLRRLDHSLRCFDQSEAQRPQQDRVVQRH